MAELGSLDRPLLVAVVGSGPSGFYAVETLLKSHLNIQISLIEKLPAPFGLVRYGVAPDHPKLKQVSLLFHKHALHPNVEFYGNVELGNTIALEDLRRTHHAIILCYGAESDRRLCIPGEDLTGSHTATEFVAWYNGHPGYRDCQFDLSSEVAVIVGQGNVAADVCRILAKHVDDLRQTDIASHALDILAESRVREIHVVGRRGPVQTKFTSKELRELGELPGCSATTDIAGFELALEDRKELEEKTNDNAVKCFGIFREFAQNKVENSHRQIRFHFLLSPQCISGKGRVERMTFTRNKLLGPAFGQWAEPTGESVDIECSLCFRSIGYRGEPLDGVPFDERRGIIPNCKGRVLRREGQPAKPLYVSGWIKRGPTGIIGTNRLDSAETVETLLSDLKYLDRDIPERMPFDALLTEMRIRRISYDQWQLIDSAETQQGRRAGKPREKITSVDQMLAIAG